MVLQDLLLLLHCTGLINNIAPETSHVIPDVLHLVLDELELGLGLEGHVVNLTLVVVVFLADRLQLLVTVLLDLLNRHPVTVD